MDKYTQICLYYGITESAMDNYVYEYYMLNEAEQVQSAMDAKYANYVAKCKAKGIPVLPKNEWMQRRSKITKGLAIGAGAAALVAGNAAINRTQAGRDWKHNMKMKKIERQNEINYDKALKTREENKLKKKGKHKTFRARHFGF